MGATKDVRFAEFLRRFSEAAPASSVEAALMLLAATLNAVDDDLSGISFDPARHRSDGRMYPPQADSKRNVPERADVTRFRSRAHNTLIGRNGAIRVEEITGTLLLSKAGADGRTI